MQVACGKGHFFDSEMHSTCPFCGVDGVDLQIPPTEPLITSKKSPHQSHVFPYALRNNTLLIGRYHVEKVLGSGGFGVTYLAFDQTLQTRVAIKEYFPRDLVTRDASSCSVIANTGTDAKLFNFGMDKFLMEARILAQFKHPNIVRVQEFFQANNTAYLVMDYYIGMPLALLLKRTECGFISEPKAVGIIDNVLSALIDVHENAILHKDIKPSNIYVSVQGLSVLLDFGTARSVLGDRSRSLSVVVSEGFAPFEQYHRKGKIGPWTDIYGCAATLYTILGGTIPIGAAERLADDSLPALRDLKPDLSKELCEVVMSGLALHAHERPQSAREFQGLIRKACGLTGSQLDASRKMLGNEIREFVDTVTASANTDAAKTVGLSALNRATVRTSFFDGFGLTKSVFFATDEIRVKTLYESLQFYRDGLNAEYQTLSRQARVTYSLWVASVVFGLIIVGTGITLAFVGHVAEGAITSASSSVVLFIQRIFAQREDHYRNLASSKHKHLEYGNKWLLSIQTIDSIVDPKLKAEEHTKLAKALLKSLSKSD
jgi:serine/threonine protein kinase